MRPRNPFIGEDETTRTKSFAMTSGVLRMLRPTLLLGDALRAAELCQFAHFGMNDTRPLGFPAARAHRVSKTVLVVALELRP